MEIYNRLFDYLESVAKVLAGNAQAASVFANPADVGSTREGVYKVFLSHHVPHWCDVVLGGFLFNSSGQESGQVDIIVTAGSVPKFQFLASSEGKSFCDVDGVMCVASIKSNLNNETLIDALNNFAKIPQARTEAKNVNPQIKNVDLDAFMLKVLYATKSVQPDRLLAHVNAYYADKPSVPSNRRPDVIHVNGSAYIFKARGSETYGDHLLEKGRYYLQTGLPDVFALAHVIDKIKERALMIPNILFATTYITDPLQEVSRSRGIEAEIYVER